MSLATRCGQCGTVFRVVEDQLKVSEGWVRCGRCEAVFNALEALFDLDREPPPPWPPAGAPDAAAADEWPDEAPASSVSASQRGPLEPPPFEPSDLPSDGSVSAHLEHRPLLHEPGDDDRHVDRRFEPTHPPPLYDDDPLPEPPMFAPSAPLPLRESAPDLPPPAAPVAASAAAAAAAPAAGATVPAPDFVRRADRSARWQRPGLRAVLALAALLLAALLVGQIGVRWRDTLAARWPESAPALRALCRVAGCAVEPLRRVESLTVDNSGLVGLEGSGNHYRFDVTVRNHDRVAVLLPHFELTLTDAQGLVVARKVLAPSELGSSATTLAPGGTLALRGVLAGGERKLAGYTVEIFYP